MSGDGARCHGDIPDRRNSRRRHQLQEHGITHARVRPGFEATIVDVSAGGALVETTHRLLPGSSIELQVGSSDRRVSMRGKVLRCTVTRLCAATVWYRGAVEFDQGLPWFSGH